jgi:hypothetical protein
MHWLFLLHRYLGIAVGTLMAAWCVSGIVMMYVAYPVLDPHLRLAGLEPLNWDRCCVIPAAALADADRLGAVQVEMLAGRPTLALYGEGRPHLVDLRSGRVIQRVAARRAAAAAGGFADRIAPTTPRLLGLINDDQWTVAGEFDGDRPLYHFALDDAARTEVYVSSSTGHVVQATRGRERFWNWLGAVPHWLYFSALRRNAHLWRQVVIATALLGCFLVAVGLFIGARQISISAAGQSSPYRGVNLWHHIAGLIFGLFALSWVVSGLLSMNPWGWLQGEGSGEERTQLRGHDPSGAEFKAGLIALAKARPSELVSLSIAPLAGQLYFIGSSPSGDRQRFSAGATAAPLDDADVAFMASALPGSGGALPQLMTHEDDYYFRHFPDVAPLPVYRVTVADVSADRYYLDAVSGDLLLKADRAARRYRWLQQGLHRWDFEWLRGQPLWDVLMLLLMSGVTALCGSGAYLGYRRLLRR